MNNLKVFEHGEFGRVRIVRKDDEHWFVAADVCAILGTDTRDIPSILDPDEQCPLMDTIHTLNENNGLRKDSRIISESGLYSLVLRSRKPEAKAFKRWITHDVLPSIRKTGGYIAARADETPEQIMARAVLVAQDTIERMKGQLAQLETQAAESRPLVNFAKAVQASEDTILVKQLAGFLKQNGIDTGQNRLFEWLRGNGYLCRERGENWNRPTQKSMNLGLFETKESISINPDGSTRLFFTSKVTGKGQLYFLHKFSERETLTA